MQHQVDGTWGVYIQRKHKFAIQVDFRFSAFWLIAQSCQHALSSSRRPALLEPHLAYHCWMRGEALHFWQSWPPLPAQKGIPFETHVVHQPCPYTGNLQNLHPRNPYPTNYKIQNLKGTYVGYISLLYKRYIKPEVPGSLVGGVPTVLATSDALRLLDFRLLAMYWTCSDSKSAPAPCASKNFPRGVGFSLETQYHLRTLISPPESKQMSVSARE